jgi:hypothetical protein
MKKTPEEAFLSFSTLYPPIPPFRDASAGLSTMNVTIVDCLKGLLKGVECGFIDFDNFNYKAFVK